ncbi:MAG: sugar phosphate isomerase/epimerase family protein [Candidatus Latescibacterota bacterium]
MKELKFGACLPTFDSCADRYCLSGYGPKRSLEEMFERASQVEHLKGVELVGNWHLNEENFGFIGKMLAKYHLEVSMMVPDLWTQAKWGKGSFASKNATIREEAVQEVTKVMDMAADIGCDKVDVWLGQDGFDYSFQADYAVDWEHIIAGIGQCADHRKDIKVCIEYKLKEPRKHCYIDSAAKTMLILHEIQRENVGILLDVGHSIAAQENPSEAAALISRMPDKLFYIHLNDNYRSWDDDMIFGSVNTITLLEFMYWLDEIGYDDYYTLDIFPFREDGVRAAEESIAWVTCMKNILNQIGRDTVKGVIRSGDATQGMKMIREAISPRVYTDRPFRTASIPGSHRCHDLSCQSTSNREPST